ncbi:MAG: EamA family transporter [Saprospiraceae bacterium]|nr:EamA family transporter [Saprospiraceae bacterium]
MSNQTLKAYGQIHLAVLLYGLTAILGDVIALSAVMIVWWRVLITSISLFFLIKMGKTLIGLSPRLIKIYGGIGVLIALHWITFYGSIKLANASVALICFSTTALFTAILEPIITKKPFNKLDLSLAMIIIPGMWMVVAGTDASMHLGIAVGLISALLIAVFAILNKIHIEGSDQYTISFIEMFSATIFITLLLPFLFMYGDDIAFLPPRQIDWIYLLIMSLLCTTLAYVLSLKALRYISAFAINLVFNLEPIYGIILAVFILNEQKELSAGFYLGSFIIIASIIIYPLMKHRYQKS